MKRYVAIAFSSLLTDWHLRRHPNLRDIPFVVAAKEHGRGVITAVSAAVCKEGIGVGTTVADARALLPGLEVLEEEPGLDVRLLHGLAGWCIRFAPEVAVDGPDGILLDGTGCAHLWGGEVLYLKHIRCRLEDLGYQVQVAITGTIGASRALARFGRTDAIAENGAEAEALKDLPPAALRVEAEVVERLRKLGLYRIGDLLTMPCSSLRRRFGPGLLHRLDQALGKQWESLEPIVPAVPYHERLACLEPIVTAKGIAIALQELLFRLCNRLEKEQQGIRILVFSGFRVDGKLESVSISTSRPSRNIRHLKKLFEPKLSGIEPALGIELFSLEAKVVEELTAAAGKLWEYGGRTDAAGLAELVDRIEGKLGAGAVKRYLPDEHHLPERSVKTASSLEEKPSSAWKLDRPRPLYLLPSPERIEVAAPIPDYPPLNFRYKGSLHKVVKADGPERIEQEWWIRDGEHRDYYTVENETGQRYWLFRLGHYSEERKPSWYLHGFFA